MGKVIFTTKFKLKLIKWDREINKLTTLYQVRCIVKRTGNVLTSGLESPEGEWQDE